jgi:23S rRNA pseudouridine1911/1915/1917 synthase
MAVSGPRLETVAAAAEDVGERLDRVLAARIGDVSRSRVKALILDGQVTAGGRTILDPGYRVNARDVFAITVPPPEPAEPEAEAIPLAVVYEDAHLIVIDKPAGLVVHRLDKDTSGLLVVAKNDRAHRKLAAQFADHGRTGPLTRGYLAFAWGAPERPKGTVDAPLARHPHARDKIAVRPDGREAVTHWERRETYPGEAGGAVASLLACTLETGRTHQIRVHLAHIGHPLLGDMVYGPGFKTKAAQLGKPAQDALAALKRQALHAYMLGFEHPESGDYVEFQSELPADLARLRVGLTGR